MLRALDVGTSIAATLARLGSGASVGALGLGVMAGALTLPHSDGEVLYTLVGVGLLALGHDLNRRAVI